MATKLLVAEGTIEWEFNPSDGRVGIMGSGSEGFVYAASGGMAISGGIATVGLAGTASWVWEASGALDVPTAQLVGLAGTAGWVWNTRGTLDVSNPAPCDWFTATPPSDWASPASGDWATAAGGADWFNATTSGDWASPASGDWFDPKEC